MSTPATEEQDAVFATIEEALEDLAA
ncbi:MAG: hypothetical protein JWO90_3276, partial [Solirubrobacterales bacterium]|nr:hypothetical protein [Solirubrobacterales bacterium]